MKEKIQLLGLLFLTSMMIGCSSDANQLDVSTSLTRQQLQGTWQITYFKDQVDKTTDYNGYLFTFDLEDDIAVDADGSSSNGEFVLYQDQINNETYAIIDVEFSQSNASTTVNDRLRELTEEWIVKRVLNNATMIELEERISNNPPEIMHLTKI